MKKLTSKLSKIVTELNPVEITTPVNEAECAKQFKDAFVDNVLLEPIFVYNDELLDKVSGYSRDLNNLKRNFMDSYASPVKNGTDEQNQFVRELIIRRINESLEVTRLASAIKEDRSKKAMHPIRELYGDLSSQMINYAYYYENRGFDKTFRYSYPEAYLRRFADVEYDAEGIKKVFDNILYLYDIPEWSTVICDQATAIDARDLNSSGKPQIYIPASRKVNGMKLIELIGHEIECHVRDSANSRNFWEQVLSEDFVCFAPFLAKSCDEVFYEGHAKHSDVTVSGAYPSPYNVIAMDFALRGYTFSQTFERIYKLKLLRGTSVESAINSAWTITRRTYRGSRAFASGYAFLKDKAYFEGYLTHRIMGADFASMKAAEIDGLSKVGFMLKPRFKDLRYRYHPEEYLL